MPIMGWSASLGVGVGSIDEQHKKLVSLVNELYDAMIVGRGKAVLGRIFTDVIDYTVYHFQTEEQYFKQHAYPGMASHVKEHEDLIRTVTELKKAFEGNKATITLDMMNFLKDWLVKHIMKSDKDFGPFLTSRGVK